MDLNFDEPTASSSNFNLNLTQMVERPIDSDTECVHKSTTTRIILSPECTASVLMSDPTIGTGQCLGGNVTIEGKNDKCVSTMWCISVHSKASFIQE